MFCYSCSRQAGRSAGHTTRTKAGCNVVPAAEAGELCLSACLPRQSSTQLGSVSKPHLAFRTDLRCRRLLVMRETASLSDCLRSSHDSNSNTKILTTHFLHLLSCGGHSRQPFRNPILQSDDDSRLFTECACFPNVAHITAAPHTQSFWETESF